MTAAHAGLDVLLIEDEALIAMLLEDLLADLGHRVVATVGRLDRAMKLAAELPLDLAIVDVNLNGEESYPLATILTARRVPFVFSTGYGIDGLKKEWRGVPVLQKPFQTRELAEAISKVTRSQSPPE